MLYSGFHLILRYFGDANIKVALKGVSAGIRDLKVSFSVNQFSSYHHLDLTMYQ